MLSPLQEYRAVLAVVQETGVSANDGNRCCCNIAISLIDFVTMNNCSGGNRWLAEICRVNPVAAEGRKGPDVKRVLFRKQPAAALLRVALCRGARNLRHRRLALRKVLHRERRAHRDMSPSRSDERR